MCSSLDLKEFPFVPKDESFILDERAFVLISNSCSARKPICVFPFANPPYCRFFGGNQWSEKLYDEIPVRVAKAKVAGTSVVLEHASFIETKKKHFVWPDTKKLVSDIPEMKEVTPGLIFTSTGYTFLIFVILGLSGAETYTRLFVPSYHHGQNIKGQ